MNVLIRLTASGLVGFLALSNSLPALAQSLSPVVKVTAGFSDIRYHLVDLSPNDGVKPWVQFADAAIDQGYSGYADAHGQVLNSDFTPAATNPYSTRLTFPTVFPNTTAGAVSKDGTASVSISPTSLSSSAWLTEQQFPLAQPSRLETTTLSNLTSESYTGQGTPFYAYLGMLYPWDPSVAPLNDPLHQQQAPEFKLSANTAIVFEGNTVADASVVDAARLPEGTFVYSGAGLSFEVYADQRFSGVGPVYGSEAEEAFGYQTRTFSVGGGNDGFPSIFAGTLPFAVTFTNATGASIDAHLAMSTYASVNISGLPVPEPTTYVLMGLGLVGIALAKRRARSA